MPAGRYRQARLTDLKDRRQDREIAINLKDQVFRDVKSEADTYGIFFMIWLRSGGHFSFTPRDVAEELHPDKDREARVAGAGSARQDDGAPAQNQIFDPEQFARA